jgi:hypothetical protein
MSPQPEQNEILIVSEQNEQELKNKVIKNKIKDF